LNASKEHESRHVEKVRPELMNDRIACVSTDVVVAWTPTKSVKNVGHLKQNKFELVQSVRFDRIVWLLRRRLIA
jgi:hypothetical protein